MMHHQTAYVQQYQQSLIQTHPQQQQLNQMHPNHSHPSQMQTIQMAKMGKRPIAPAPAPQATITSASLEHNHQLNRVSSTITSTSKKTKMTYAHMAYAATQPASVQRRNARERNRVKQVNMGFNNLRQHIPSDVISKLSNGGRGASKKLSKVDTLRMAVDYIRSLQGLLDESDLDSLSSSSSAASSNSSTSSTASSNSYYAPSPVQCSTIQPPPPCSESSASPTPSYSSDNSSIGHTNYIVPQTYKYEPYDAYNPDEEELLDAISWWQQQ